MLNTPTFQSAWVKPRWSVSALGFKRPKKPFDWKTRLFVTGMTFVCFGSICLWKHDYKEFRIMTGFLLSIRFLDILCWFCFDWYQ